MCSMSPDDVQYMLKAHGLGSVATQITTGGKKWYLASDMATCYAKECPIEDKLRKVGALTIDVDAGFKAIGSSLADFKKSLNPTYTLPMYIAPTVDLWAAVQADFYFGKVFSTFDESACFLRGREALNKSNICFGMDEHYQCPQKFERAKDGGDVCPSRRCHPLSGLKKSS